MPMFMTKEEAEIFRNGTIEQCVAMVNEVLTRVYNKAVESAINQTPDLMLRLLVSTQAQQKMTKEFYERNPGFKEYPGVVQSVVKKVEVDNPGKNYDFILSLAEPIIRNSITKVKELEKLALDKPINPSLDGKGIV